MAWDAVGDGVFDRATTSMSRSDEPGSVRELLRVAIPLALSTGTISIMLVTDRLCLTWYSEDALAASMPAGVLSWTLIALGLGIVSYVTAFVAQYYGAGRKDRVGAAVWQGVYLSFITSLIIAPFAIFSEPIFAAIGHPKEVQVLEVEYFRILVFNTLPMLLSGALGCFYNGRGKTTPVLWANVTSMLVNCVLDFVFIFGWGPIPSMGVAGAAIATVIGSWCGVIAFLVILAIDADARGYGLVASRRFDTELFGRLLRFGFPNGLMMFLEAAAFVVFISIIGTLAPESVAKISLAATNVAFTLNTFAFVPILGLQIAVLSLVGQRIGEGRPDLAEKTTWVATRICTAYMACWAVLYIFLPDIALWVFARYSSESFQEVRDVTVVLLWFVAAYTMFDGWQLIFGAATRGAGDTRFSLWFHAGTAWAVMVLPTYIVVEYFGGGLYAAWTVVTLWVVVLAVGFYLRFRQGKWKTMQVIETSAAEPVQEDEVREDNHELIPLA